MKGNKKNLFKRSFTVLLCFIMAVTLYSGIKPAEAASNAFKVHFIDADGTSTLIESNNDYVLIDGGYKTGETTRYLKNKMSKVNGKYVLQAIIISHNHKDHMYEVSDLILKDPEFIVKNIYFSTSQDSDSDNINRLCNAIHVAQGRYSISVHKLNINPKENPNGKKIKLTCLSDSNLNVTIYIPPVDCLTKDTLNNKYIWYKDSDKSVNNNSLVVKATYKSRSVLMLGDLYGNGLYNMVAAYGAEEFKTDFCVIGHHGSRSYDITDKTLYSFNNGTKLGKSEVELYNTYIQACVYITPNQDSNGKFNNKLIPTASKFDTKYYSTMNGTVTYTYGDDSAWRQVKYLG